MNTMTNFLKTKTLNACLGIAVQSWPTTMYLAAYTTATTNAGGGTEVVGGSYARQVIAFGAPTIVSLQALTSNTAIIDFPVATASWGTITHIAIMDALTGGNMLYHGAVTAPKTIASGDQLRVMASDFKVYQN